MTLVVKILEELTKSSLNYKGLKVNILGIPKFQKHSNNSIKVTLCKLKKKGLVNKNQRGWIITSAGEKYMKKKNNSLLNFTFDFPKNSPKNLIVMFDIPESRKPEREWLRWHLKKFNYIMIQKSVWVGPSPLPKEFMEYIEKIKLKDTIKTFKLAKNYNLG